MRQDIFSMKKQNKLMLKKHKNVCKVLNYIEHLLTVISTITGCNSSSAFASLAGISVGITSFVIGLKICVISTGIKNYKSLINKKKKKHDKVVLLARCKLSRI